MKSFVSIYRVRCTKSFLSQIPANICIFNLNLMVSDNRESSLISSIKSTLNIFRTVSSLIAYVGREIINEGCWGGGWGGGLGGGGVHVHHVHMFISLRRQGNNQRGVLGWGLEWWGGGAGVVGVDPLEGAESLKVSKSVFDNLQLHNSLTHSNFWCISFSGKI